MSTQQDNLTAIANAIRSKKGTSKTIKANNFAEEIRSIQVSDNQFAHFIEGTLENMVIPDNVTKIADYAFYRSAVSGELIIPETVQIGLYAFQYCNISSLKLAGQFLASNTSGYCFANCANLKTVDFLPSCESVKSRYCFANSGLTRVFMPKTLKNLEFHTFINCEDLKEVIFEDGATTNLSGNSFSKCYFLTTLQLSSAVSDSANYPNLANCTALEFITLADDFNGNYWNFSSSNLYSTETMVSMLTALSDRTGLSANRMTFGSENIAKLTQEQIAIATAKNWTLS